MEVSEGKAHFQNRERKTREGEIYEEIVVVLQEFDLGSKALRVIPRGKQWLTVYRAHQVKISQNL